jgi:hypothetical protein
MEPFYEKVLLAVIALILGLLAEPVKKIITRERKRLTYSISTKQILGIDSGIPDALRSQIPSEWSGYLVQFHIRAVNSGAQLLKDINVLITTKPDSEIKYFEYRTSPSREVPVGKLSIEKPNELRAPDITLTRNQSVDFDVFVKATTQPELQLYWSGGGGDVDWRIAGSQEAFGIERDIISAIKYFIYAQVAGPAITALLFAFAFFVGFWFGTTRVSEMGAAIGSFLGQLVTLFFYIKMVPHALAVAKQFMASPHISITKSNIEGPASVPIAPSSSEAGIGTSKSLQRASGS